MSLCLSFNSIILQTSIRITITLFEKVYSKITFSLQKTFKNHNKL